MPKTKSTDLEIERLEVELRGLMTQKILARARHLDGRKPDMIDVICKLGLSRQYVKACRQLMRLQIARSERRGYL